MSNTRKPEKLPSYRHHKASGQAFVCLSGRHVYLGPHSTKLSRDAYDREVQEWLARGRRLAQERVNEPTSIAVLLNAFRKSDVIPASHADGFKAVIKIMARLYGITPADDFGAVSLKVVRTAMVKEGWKRKTVNERVFNVRRIFKWGVEHQLVRPDGLIAMREVASLTRGRTTAPESKPIQPIDLSHVEACIAHMPPTVAAMVRIQMLTGMRAGELCMMRTGDIDTAGDVWVYRPATHKTAHLGKLREIAIGPKAIAALKPQLLADLQAYIFSPARADAERRAARAARRKTPIGRGNRPGTNQKAKPQKTAGERYDTRSYRQAINYATDQAFPPPPALARLPREKKLAWKVRLGGRWLELIAFRKSVHWHSHQLRHAFGTIVINQFGAEHTQRALGHSHLKTSQIYGKLSLDKSREVARAIG